MKVVVVIALSMTTAILYASEFYPISQWHRPEMAQALQTYVVVHKEPMRDYLARKGKRVEFEGDVWLVTLEHDLRAVFKPTKYSADMYAEVGAYRASCYLGFPHIPPTVIRTIYRWSNRVSAIVG